MTEIRHVAAAPTRAQRLAAGATITPHRHDEHQIVYAGRGVLTVETDAGSWVAPPTRAIWIPAGTVHAHHAHGNTELHLVGVREPMIFDRPAVLNVSPLLRELIRAYTSDPGGSQPHKRPSSERQPDERQSGKWQPHERQSGERQPDERPSSARRLDGASGMAGTGGDARERMLAVLIDQVWVSPQQPLHLPAPSDPRLVAVCDMLRADPADDRTLSALGRQAGAGDRTLSRLFQRELGMSFPQWRTQLRLHRALVLLAEGLPVTAVASRCGWASASAFIDVFRRAFGHPPGRIFRDER